MEQLAPTLPLREEIQQALLGADVAEQKVLHWLQEHEQGNWNGCDRLALRCGLNKQTLANCYAKALVWAESAMSVT
jgi:c-di-GMP-related signal transduction protein